MSETTHPTHRLRIAPILTALLLVCAPAWPCTYEQRSIVSGLEGATTLVFGRIQTVRMGGLVPSLADLSDAELAELRDSGAQVEVLESVTFEIERVFRGNLEPDPVTFTFDPEESDPGNTCYGPIRGFTQPGAPMFVSLRQPGADGTYRPPVGFPGTIGFSEEVPLEEQPMFRYVHYVAEHGQSPIQFHFKGASTQVTGDSLRAEMVVENRMGLPVSIKLGGDYPAILDGEVTFLHLRTLGAEPLADPPDLVEVKGEDSATVALGDYFEVGDPGRHGWSVVMSIVRTPGANYLDRWVESNVFEFTATEPTAVEAVSWARVKTGE